MTPEERVIVSLIFNDLNYPTIVELGAHTGEDGKEFAGMIKNSGDFMHIMVEPDPRNCQMILDNYLALGNHTKLIVGAIANRDEFRRFNFSDQGNVHGSGSLLYPTKHLEEFPNVHFDYAGMVPCYQLDTIYRKYWLGKIDLLWVDIQGAEKEMIQGGQMALSKTRYLFMEAEDKALYEGQALKPELIAMLPGWSMVQDFGYNILLKNNHFVPPWGV